MYNWQCPIKAGTVNVMLKHHLLWNYIHLMCFFKRAWNLNLDLQFRTSSIDFLTVKIIEKNSVQMCNAGEIMEF